MRGSGPRSSDGPQTEALSSQNQRAKAHKLNRQVGQESGGCPAEGGRHRRVTQLSKCVETTPEPVGADGVAGHCRLQRCLAL